jgi:hypothetical protein
LSVATRVAEGIAGDMGGWQQAVAAAIATPNCPHWLIGLVAGFAGTISALTGLDTCGINVSGFTSSGKTITQKLSASAWGSPCVGAALLQSMRTTENALESLAQASNGTVLALDEVAHVDGRAVGRMIYSVASGIGKARMNAQAELKGRYTWQTFIIFSNECGLEAKVRSEGGTWFPGMEVRLVDIDVTGVNRNVDRETLDAIGGIERHYGHAGPAFVEGLVLDGWHSDPEALRREVLRAAGKIAEDTTGALVRAAVPFALLLVAGELAKAFGVLPSTAGVRQAVLWAWKRYAGSGRTGHLEPTDMDRRALGRHGEEYRRRLG